MSTKDFEKGIAAGVKPVGEKLEQLGHAVGELADKQEQAGEWMSTLSKSIEEKDALRQLGLETYHDLTELEENERIILMSLTHWMAKREMPTEDQQKYLSSLGRFLGTTGGKADVEPGNVMRYIPDTAAHKVFLRVVLEYIYLGSQSWSFSEAQRELVESFEVSLRTLGTLEKEVEDEYRILGGAGVAQKYDVRETKEKAPKESKVWKKFFVFDFPGEENMTGQIQAWLRRNGVECQVDRELPDDHETTLRESIFFTNKETYAQLGAGESTTFDEIIYDKYGCLIASTGRVLYVVYDDKYSFDPDEEVEFCKYYLETCKGLSSLDPTVKVAKERIEADEKFKDKYMDHDGTVGDLLGGAKERLNDVLAETQKKIAGEDEKNRLRKVGSSLFGMATAIPSTVVGAGLEAGKTVSCFTGAVTSAIADFVLNSFYKYQKLMQQNLLLTKLFEHLEEVRKEILQELAEEEAETRP